MSGSERFVGNSLNYVFNFCSKFFKPSMHGIMGTLLLLTIKDCLWHQLWVGDRVPFWHIFIIFLLQLHRFLSARTHFDVYIWLFRFYYNYSLFFRSFLLFYINFYEIIFYYLLGNIYFLNIFNCITRPI